jgi:hypothetical protein
MVKFVTSLCNMIPKSRSILSYPSIYPFYQVGIRRPWDNVANKTLYKILFVLHIHNSSHRISSLFPQSFFSGNIFSKGLQSHAVIHYSWLFTTKLFVLLTIWFVFISVIICTIRLILYLMHCEKQRFNYLVSRNGWSVE